MVEKLSELRYHVGRCRVLDVVGGVELDAHVARVGQQVRGVRGTDRGAALNLVPRDAMSEIRYVYSIATWTTRRNFLKFVF